MTLLRKDAPGSAPGDYTWDGPDDVVDVPPDLAHELLHQPDGGFHEVFDQDTDAGAAAAAEKEAAEAAEREAAEKQAEREAAEVARKAAADADATPAPLPTHKADLQALARELSLDESGTVKELTARITAHRTDTQSHEDNHGDDGPDDETRTPVTEPDPSAQ